MDVCGIQSEEPLVVIVRTFQLVIPNSIVGESEDIVRIMDFIISDGVVIY